MDKEVENRLRINKYKYPILIITAIIMIAMVMERTIELQERLLIVKSNDIGFQRYIEKGRGGEDTR